MRLLLLACLTGCLGKAGVVCDDNTLCPDDTTCAVVGGAARCVSADQRAQCAGIADRATCRISGQPIGVCHDQVCVRAGCGDSFVTGAEQCDGHDLGDGDTNADGVIDCRDAGYYDAGALACRDDCTFERSGCSNAGRCGDGMLNGAEECDGDALPLGTACEAYPITPASPVTFHSGGLVACSFDCTLVFTGCTGGYCGDGVKQAGEACDGFDVGAETCAPYSGNVTCSADCNSVIRDCAGSCGDSIVNGPEVCDRHGSTSVMPAGISCATYGFDDGAPTCTPACDTIEIATCQNYCGDGILQGGEACDGADHGGIDCSSFGTRGALGCDASCQRDFSSCQTGGWVRRTHPTFVIGGVLTGVWSQNGASAFVIGGTGVWEWNGTTWIAHHLRLGSGLPTTLGWTAVWGDERNAWVAGASSVYRYEPLEDRLDPQTSAVVGRGVWIAESVGTVAVQGLWGDGGALYAATTNGVYRRASTGSWAIEPGTSGHTFLAIHGRGDTVVAVGMSGAFRKIGAGPWTQIEPSPWQYVSVWSGSTIWLATTSAAAVYRDGAPAQITMLVMPPAFQPPNTLLIRGIFAAASDDVYLAAQGTPNALLRWNGAYQGNAPQLAQLSIGTLPVLGALGGSSAGDIWLVGAGAAFHLDGLGWQPPLIAAPSIPPIDHAAVAVTASSVWFGGASTLVTYDAATPVPAPYALSTASSLSALWANDDVLWIANGIAVSAVAASPPPGTTLSQPAVAAWGAGEHVFFASTSTVAHFDGVTWTEEVLPATTTPQVRAISGSSPDDVWAVGGTSFDSQLYHRANGTWTQVPGPAAVAGYASAVWSAAPGDAWYALTVPSGDTPASHLAHWDGTAWSVFGPAIPLAQILSIWGSDPFDVWAVGTMGTVLHYDGRRWTPIAVPTFDDLVAIEGSGRDHVWAVGKNGVRLALTHPLPATSAGRCARAVELYCGSNTSFGTTFGDAPAFYRFESPALPYPTTLALAVTAGVELTVHRATSADDPRCDLEASPLAPLMFEDPTSFSMTAEPGAVYYIEVRRAAGVTSDSTSYTLTSSCTYAPLP